MPQCSACPRPCSQQLAEAGQALSSGEEATLQALLRQKEELTRERDEQARRRYQLLAAGCADRHGHSLCRPGNHCCLPRPLHMHDRACCLQCTG